MNVSRILLILSVIFIVLGVILKFSKSTKPELNILGLRMTKKHLFDNALLFAILAIAFRIVLKM